LKLPARTSLARVTDKTNPPVLQGYYHTHGSITISAEGEGVERMKASIFEAKFQIASKEIASKEKLSADRAVSRRCQR
jgi:hypothetical protein